MVPLHLRLRNFMSYGLDGGELDLRNIHLACLSGGNGFGKSSLIDAMTWAIWGRSRAAREDDLLRQGTNEMEVEFEFAANHAVYRVIRKRLLRKSTSVAVLELAVRDGDVYRAITGGTMLETERAIAGILRLSYETFINSSLLLQGKADLFTVKRPGERKEVLAEILGLGRYETLAEAAREQEREFRAEVERHNMHIEDLDRFIAGLPAVRETLASVEKELAGAQARAAAADLLVTEHESRLHTLSDLSASLERLGERLATIATEAAATERRRDEARQRYEAARHLLEDEATIRASLAELVQVRRENDLMVAALQQFIIVHGRKTVIQGRIDNEKKLLHKDHAQLCTDLEKARQAAADCEQQRAKLAEVRRESQRLEVLQAAMTNATERLNALKTQSSSLQAVNELRKERMKALRQKINMLRSAPECPVCGTTLSEQERAHVLDAYLEEGTQAKAEVAANEQEIDRLEQEAATLQRDLHAQQPELRRLQTLCKTEGQLEARVADLERAAAALPLLAEEETRLARVLESCDFAHEDRALLAGLGAESAAIGYDSEAHATIRERIAILAAAEDRVAGLDQAREALQQAALDLQSAEIALANHARERERLLEERVPLHAATREIPMVQVALAERQRERDGLRAAERQLHERLGGLRRQIEEGEARTQARAEAVKTRDDAAEQVSAYHELNVIFGKRGVQAMLIENALPELEQDTNELLARMTDNSTQVQFATQRQGKSGNAIETLEIRIADNMGTRPYEMFSGGEAFRINFAIRIALSKLLARQSGADLSFLLIDEGFGSQDAQGRDRLIEAITAIADDFEKILVVTHIDELKDQFDVHIEVSKGPSGSHITISAA